MRASLVMAWAGLVLLVGCSKPAPIVEPLPSAPHILAFTSTTSVVQPGERVTLTWDTRDATSVEIRSARDGVVAGATGLSGTVEVSVESDTLFVLVASDARGRRDSAALWVEVDDGVADVYFSASPSQIASGDPVTLAWHAPGAHTVGLATKGGGPLDLANQLETGSVDVNPTVNTTWVLTVDGVSYEASVEVTPVIELLVATPDSAHPGEQLRVSWKTHGADRVTLTLANQGDLLSETEAGKVAEGSFDYLVPLSQGAADALSFTLRAESQTSSASASIQVFVSGSPRVQSWTVPRYALTGATFILAWETANADLVEILRDGVAVYRSPSLELAEVGEVTFPTPAEDHTFQLRAINSRGGVTLSDEVVVSPVGTPDPTNSTFTASVPNLANGGNPVTLTWNVPNARNLKLVAKNQFTVQTFHGLTAETGSIQVYPNRDTEYRITGDNGVGTTIQPLSASVTVTAPAHLVFGPDNVPVGAGVGISANTIAGAGRIVPLNFAAENDGVHTFIDISSTGTEIPFPLGTTTTSQLVQLPRTFETTWRGEKIGGDSISVNLRGWMLFSPVPVSLSSVPNRKGTVALYGGGLISGANTHVLWQLDGMGDQQRLIVQWTDAEVSGAPSKVYSFQAQLYAHGEVVLAYPKVPIQTGQQSPSIGVLPVEADPNGWIKPSAAQLTNFGMPEQGDVFALFSELPPSYLYTAAAETLSVSVEVGNSHIVIDDAVKLVPTGLAYISEAMANPPTGSTNGEWIELTSNSATPFDLNGWTLEFGGGSKHTITSALQIPPNGSLLLGQSSTSAGTATVNYVYGPSFTLPKDGSPILLTKANGKYSSLDLGKGISSISPGYSIQRGTAATGISLPTGATLSDCTAPRSATYAIGAYSAYGTPGAPNPPCPSFVGSSIPGAFETLATSGGTAVVLPTGNTNNDIAPVPLPVPVRFGGLNFSTVYVSTNGYLTFAPLTCTGSTNGNSCFPSNPANLNATTLLAPVGAVAPFWDDLDTNAGGIYWKRGVDYTVISWENARKLTTGETYSLNFQVKFFDSGNIEFHFGTMSGTGGTGGGSANRAKGLEATTWLQTPKGDAAFILNANATTPGINPNTGYRFTAQ